MKKSLMFQGLLAVLLVATFALPMSAQQRKPGKSANAIEKITAAQMREMLTFIAADELEGRDTPSRGLDLTARFLAYNLARWGFKPAGDNGTFFQKFWLQRGGVDFQQTKLELNGQAYQLGADFIPRAVSGTAQGQLVYVGPGIMLKAKNINSFAGVDVKDKIVIAADGAFPKGVQYTDLKGKVGEDYDNALSYAERNGAKALVIVPSPAYLKNWQMIQRQAMSGRVTLESAPSNAGGIPVVIASDKLVQALFQGESSDGSAILNQVVTTEFSKAFALKPEKEINLTVVSKVDSLPTQNVVAIWEGTDPKLKEEYVAIGAHYDHFGARPSTDEGKTDGWSRYKLFLQSAGRLEGSKDTIWNGADDDGSGTAAVLSIAEALSQGPRPKRSILLVWHAGEEKGLWGSEYVTDHSPVPLNQIVTQLNIDMIGRSKPVGDTQDRNKTLTGANEIYVIGSKMMSTELGQLSEKVNSDLLNLTFNYKYDDPNDTERLFYRSDHFNYARKGIPIIFYFDGVHVDYHGIDDEVERIDFTKMERVTRTVYATLWELANRAKRVTVDKQLPAQFLNN